MKIYAANICKIRSTILLCLLLSCVFSVQTAFAQKPHFDHDDQQWLLYVNIIRLRPNWIIHSNASLRWRDVYQKSFQYHARTALGYQITDHMRFLSGVGYFKPFNGTSSLQHEVRGFQEIFFNHGIGKMGLINRFQMEERFIRHVDGVQPEPMYLRFRYATFLTIPITKFSNAKNNLAFTLRNEIFLNGSDNPKDRLFDLDRVSLGPVLSLDNWRVFALWHNQVSTMSPENQYRYTSIFVFQFIHILDFRPLKEQLQGSQNYGE